MSSYKRICCICLKQEIYSQEKHARSESTRYYIKLTSIIPEMHSTELKEHGTVCLGCRGELDAVYLFREKCLRNKQFISDFISEIRSSNHILGANLKQNNHFNESNTKNDKNKTGKEVETNNFNSIGMMGNNSNDEIIFIGLNVKKEIPEIQNYEDSSETEENINNTSVLSQVNQEYTLSNVEDPLKLATDISTKEFPVEAGCSKGNAVSANAETMFIKMDTDIKIEIEESSDTEEESTATSNNVNDDLREATATSLNLLPSKSKEKYEAVYTVFENWRKKKKIKIIDEDVILAFFAEKSENLKSSSLWSHYSMLKSTLMIKKSIDIKYPRVLAFLKKQSVGYKAKKSKVFTREEIDKFLLKADDINYLMMKVALIVGLAGACRRQELCKITLDNIEDKNTILVIKIPDSKTHIERTFIVVGKNNIALYKKYVALRPPNTPHRRLFIFYKSGKCSVQPVGIHTFGKIPSKIAAYLMLPNPELYTGHGLRRGSKSFNPQM